MVNRELKTQELSDVVRLIEQLDGKTRTLVTVERRTAHAAVGGSAPTGLVVYVTFDNNTFHRLKSREAATESDKVTVVAGGQAGDHPRRLVVGAEDAKTALSYFVEHGALNPGQAWEAS